MNQQEIQAIVEKQRAFFHTGATLDVEKRIQALKKLQSCILRYEDEIGAALKQDLGKSSFESYMCESGLVLSELSYMLRHVRSYSREKRVRTPLAQFHSRSFKKPSPYGVTLIMSPWNYPFLLTIDPLVDAIAAGNTAVVKPSAYSPATSELMARILRECFPEEYSPTEAHSCDTPSESVMASENESVAGISVSIATVPSCMVFFTET